MPVEEGEDVLAVLQAGHIFDRYQNPVGGEKGILGQDIEIGTGIYDHDARQIGFGQHARQCHGASEVFLDLGQFGGGGDVIHAVLAGMCQDRAFFAQ